MRIFQAFQALLNVGAVIVKRDDDRNRGPGVIETRVLD